MYFWTHWILSCILYFGTVTVVAVALTYFLGSDYWQNLAAVLAGGVVYDLYTGSKSASERKAYNR